jgi:AcrR family transcriptional regulator
MNEGYDGKKRTRMKGTERRELILIRAKHVFACHSYPEASTGILAKESDVTEPMLYRHFGSKKGLFLEVLRTSSLSFMERWQKHVQQRADKDILDALLHVILDYYTIVKDDPEIQKIFIQAIAESYDPEIAQCVSRHNQAIYAFIILLLEDAKNQNLLIVDADINAICWGYMSMVFAMQYSQMIEMHDKFNDKVLAEMNRLWLRALQPVCKEK